MAEPTLFEASHPVKRRVSRKEWLAVDWNKKTSEIASSLNASPRHVTNMRKVLGLPGRTLRKDLYADQYRTGKTIPQIAAQNGVSICAVYCGLRHSGYKFSKNFGIKESIGSDKLAYIAGIVDGEGCISISNRLSSNSTGKIRRFGVSVAVCNTDRRMIDWLYETTGAGWVYREARKRPHWNDCFRWIVNDRYASDLIRLIRPYLVIKQEIADIALEFQQLKTSRRGIPDDGAMLATYKMFQDRIKALRIRPNSTNTVKALPLS